MSYRTRIMPFAKKQIARWGLSTTLLVEVYLRLNEKLPANPKGLLVPISDLSDGMLYSFTLVDHENRFRQHTFAFRVFYGQDEMNLIIASGVYRMDIDI